MDEARTARVRVLLLARAGDARQRLEAALADAGAELLGAVDPAEGDPAEAVALRPGAVLVALEPAIEDALERYEALLSDPGVLVMFDEAEVAARRDGWDAARWVRHLAAKLNGHEDVLPPGTEPGDALHPAPGPLPQRREHDFDVEAMADAALDLAAGVPRGDAFDAPPPPGDEPAEAGGGLGVGGLVAAEDMDWSADAGDYDGGLGDDPALAELLASAAAAAPADDADEGHDAGLGLSLELAAEGAAPAAGPASAVEPGDAVDPLTLGDGLSLAEDDGPITARADAPAVDVDALAARLEGLSLADPDSYGHGVMRGAVLVEAGLGGPDAVRQLVGGLDEGFPRAVLVRLQLDGGRYDRLVQQMQRATSVPVALAEAGVVAGPGTVYFLPPELALAEDRGRLVFVASDPQQGGYEALPAGDSALVFLSGASPARVDAAMALAGDGALVLAQVPDSCYDGAAVAALVARGAVAAAPGDLAQALLDRWP